MIDVVLGFIGSVPVDFEGMAYAGAVIVVCTVLIFAVALVYSVFSRIIRGW